MSLAAIRPVMIKADYFICPDCGAEVRVGSRGCARCASDRATKAWDQRKPWEQDDVYDGLDLPDDEFNYDEFVEKEFRGGRRKTWREWFWWGVAVALLAALVVVWMVM
ncbi:MAG: hypothetical protein ACKV19_00870 [Verrucomicrobiales bacterium]